MESIVKKNETKCANEGHVYLMMPIDSFALMKDDYMNADSELERAQFDGGRPYTFTKCDCTHSSDAV